MLELAVVDTAADVEDPDVLRDRVHEVQALKELLFLGALAAAGHVVLQACELLCRQAVWLAEAVWLRELQEVREEAAVPQLERENERLGSRTLLARVKTSVRSRHMSGTTCSASLRPASRGRPRQSCCPKGSRSTIRESKRSSRL